MLAVLYSCLMQNAEPIYEIRYFGKVSIPGNSVDKSGLGGMLEDKSPANRLGGFGSAIEWTGKNDIYLMLPDRGPGDGANSYPCRFHMVEIKPGKSDSLDFKLMQTILLKDAGGNPLSGNSGDFMRSDKTRFDPEGIRMLKNGQILVSEEYGPGVWMFDQQGKFIRQFKMPDKYLIQKKSADAAKEFPPHNSIGRITNKGFEGLALAEDQKSFVAALQGSLIQDCEAPAQDGKFAGKFLRFLQMELNGKLVREMAYPLDSQKNLVCEILCLKNDDYLVLERDGEKGPTSGCKKIFRVNTLGAGDISGIRSLAGGKLPEAIKPLKKDLFLDLLAPSHGLKDEHFPAKIEGIALGPKQPDGSRLLMVSSDNDFNVDEPSWIYCFKVFVKKNQ